MQYVLSFDFLLRLFAAAFLGSIIWAIMQFLLSPKNPRDIAWEWAGYEPGEMYVPSPASLIEACQKRIRHLAFKADQIECVAAEYRYTQIQGMFSDTGALLDAFYEAVASGERVTEALAVLDKLVEAARQLKRLGAYPKSYIDKIRELADSIEEWVRVVTAVVPESLENLRKYARWNDQE